MCRFGRFVTEQTVRFRLDGLVDVGYGTNYNVIGGFGGSKDAVVVAYTHGQRTSSGNGFDLPQIKISEVGQQQVLLVIQVRRYTYASVD